MTSKISELETTKLASDSLSALERLHRLDKKTVTIDTRIKKRNVQSVIVKAVDSQTDYEKRYYKRDFHNDAALTIVENCTNKTTSQIIDEFVCYVVDTHKTEFFTADLIQAFQTHGSSYGDIIRGAMRKLKEVKVVKIVNVARKDSNKKRYKYVVNTQNALFKDFFTADTKIDKVEKL